MIVLGLIICMVLRALTAQAKVVHSFEECKEFFYQGKEPSGMDQDTKKICQKLETRGFHYASLYSVHHKIPLYSAYTLDPACSSDAGGSKKWHLEPQIVDKKSTTYHMVPEYKATQDLYKEDQATSRDYSGTGYDRGHLNPSSFQCRDGRTATFTLTNAAPMNACFNRIHWKNWESTLRSYLLQKLVSDGGSATAFIVTGTVPDPNAHIPHTKTSEERERVTVPSHIWTAVCYKHNIYKRKSFSFGYIGRNQAAEPDIRLMSVSDLNNELSRLYRMLHRTSVSENELWSHLGTQQSIKIFVDDCFGDNTKLNKVKEVFQKLINPPVNQAVQMSSEIQNTYQAVNRAVRRDSISIYNHNNIRVSEMTVKLAFDSMSIYYNVAEDLKIYAGSACLITSAKPDAVECQLVSEKQKTAADGSRCSRFSESDDSCRCYIGRRFKPCCSSPCLYQDDLNGYKCYSGQTLIDCSPRYSLITVNGDRCLDDHPCATYGEDYYWCKTADGCDYCSPPLRNSKTVNGKYCRSNHACATYGETYTWCYTDYKNNWGYC